MELKFAIHSHFYHPSTIIFKSILFILLTLALSGCVTFNDPEVSQEYTSDQIATLNSTTTVGQSFISRRPRLNSLTIWISSPPANGDHPSNNTYETIKVELFHLPGDQTPLFTSTLVASLTSTGSPLTIRLPNIGDAPDFTYYIKLSSDSGSVQILGRDEDAYFPGQAYVNDEPVDADIAFKATYEYDPVSLLHDLSLALSQIWLIFPLSAVLFIPGWLLLEYSGLTNKFDIGERWAISIGLSLSIIPVLMLWTTQFHLKWSKAVILVVAILIGILFIFRLIQKAYKFIKDVQNKGSSNANHGGHQSDPQETFSPGLFVALLAIFLGALAIRLIMVRDLVTPAWVDSVHHALFTRLILNHGNYPPSYLPFLDLPVASYHLGFHSIAAAFTWLSGLKLEQALLLLGQVLNAMVVFSVYLMTKTITGSVPAGLFSAVITGFLTPMPAYYTSWGRYTELTGLIILPVVFKILHSFKIDLTISMKRWMIIFGALAAAGLFMIHYRVVIFLVVLIFSYLLISLPNQRVGSANQKTLLLYIFSIGLISIALVLPWLYKTVQSSILPLITEKVTYSIPFFQDFSWPYLTSALGKQSLILAGLGLVWGLLRKQYFVFLLVVWVAILFLIANLGALKLPGGGLISSSSVEIMLFIPISIFAGFFIDQIIIYWKSLIPKKVHLILTSFVILVVGSVSFIGTKQLVTIINPITILTRSADIPALDWAQTNISEGETIVINPSPWGYGIYAGNDGGYWISALAGKPSLPPPVLYGLSSSSSQINELSQQVITLSSEPVSFREFLIKNNYKYIFIGTKVGSISPAKLVDSDLFITRYHQSSVWIFEVKP